MILRLVVVVVLLGSWAGAPARAADAAKPDRAQVEFFEKHVRPILVGQCIKCHGPNKEKGGLRLDSRAAMLSGGGSGPVMIAGKADDSLLIKAIRYSDTVRMPPSKKLTDEQIAALTAWVKMGAPWPEVDIATRPSEPAKEFRITREDRAFWSFQPVHDPAPPAVRNMAWPRAPLDRFVLAALEAKGLQPMAPADKRTLLRRASFDLTGLPPTPEEIDRFLRDDSPNAFARVIDRLLASPHYGERWARHWLDVARYGEDQAHTFQARLYPNGFRYRDWVVQALNGDLPYDRFLMEQIAADLIDGPNRDERLAALGYFALGPVYYGKAIADERDDRVDTLCRGMLGLTVACARCHDHKFDPIPTRDYYSLAGIFASTQYKEYPIADPETAAEFERGQAAIAARTEQQAEFLRTQSTRLSEAMTGDIARYMVGAWKFVNQRRTQKALTVADFARREKLRDFVLDRWVSYLFPKGEDNRPHLQAWRQALAAQDAVKDLSADAEARTEVEKAAVEFQERIRSLQAKKPEEAARDAVYKEVVSGLLAIPRNQVEKLLPADARNQLKAQRAELEQLKKALPRIPTVHALTEASAPANLQVNLRGNPATLGEEAPRRFLAILSGTERPLFNQGSGRLQLAQTIASKDNPLTARVMVNRVWMHHFGKGIVATPSNFGRLGERPTNPALLDHLASRFMANGWSLKALHREIMLSATYQLSSKKGSGVVSGSASEPETTPDPFFENEQVDPANQLLWRMERRRLEVEPWRDALLAVSGNLDRTLGGPPLDLAAANNQRRTLYAKISRHNLDGLLRLFDFPDPNITSDRRPVTTVPLQQLFVLNSEFMVRQARALAARLNGTDADDTARIRRAFVLVYGRPARDAELELGLAFLQEATTPADDASKPRSRTLTPWEQYVQALLSANEFVFID